MGEDPLVDSLIKAVHAAPDDVPLRVHLADLLVQRGRAAEAVPHAAHALAADPGSTAAQEVMRRALGGTQPGPEMSTGSAVESPDLQPGEHASASGAEPEFDWAQADAEMSDVVRPMFVTSDGPDDPYPAEAERTALRLADVGGMREVKERLEVSFLMPMRNPEVRAAFGKSLRGGLLLYGPPGCGKTYIARAVAGELGAAFISVALSDVLDMWLGQSERNIHDLFVAARQAAPCVLFLDEVDALALKRSQQRGAGRNTVNQLLHELDGVDDKNEGVFVLAATNHPWDVDEALRRPGRLDRMLAVLPPDLEAREAIFRHGLASRPISGIDVSALARRCDGYTGADIAHICETAAEFAMVDSVRTGTIRLIDQADLMRALDEVASSAGPWLETARTVVEFANASGQYDDLKAYLKQRRLL